MKLNKVEESKYKDPNKVYKVPVKTYFFNHFIVSSFFKNSDSRLIEDDEINQHPTKNVESVETSNEEEEIEKLKNYQD